MSGAMSGVMRGGRAPFAAALLVVLLVLGCWLAAPAAAMAGPVDWQEVEAGPEGRQWWDSGSLRFDREGRLSVLSRFQPAAAADAADDARPPVGQLYVMQLDCDEELYRDTAVNGLPSWGATWQAAAGDNLTIRVLHAACDAARRNQESDATA
ncbi:MULTISPECIES: hypothetical protein [unclassified Synechococcus]|uniref:hypothetical protein n=1 Tax=unclassified Synechococcus TaxID=2626047 RepID=UPI002570DA13|nr:MULTISPECIES: hypothetical protein [unclassified Synechococcus]